MYTKLINVNASSKKLQYMHRSVLFLCLIAILLSLCLVSAVNQVQMATEVAEEAVAQAEAATLVAADAQDIARKAIALLKAYEAREESKVQETRQKQAESTIEQPKQGKPMTVTATGYCLCVKCCGVWSAQHPSRVGTGYVQLTSSGSTPTPNRTISTDPSVIPYGTHVLLNGIEYVAEDTGSGVEGRHIDIFFASHEEAVSWGKQTVEVLILAK